MRCFCGNILSVNQNDQVFRYLVEESGSIVYVGNALPERYHHAERIDLGDKALLPAFVDTHQHFASFSTFHAGLNVMEAKSNVEILEMVRAGAFIPYHESLLELLFFLRNHGGAHTAPDPTRA